MIDRAAFLRALVGKPYAPGGMGPETYGCWGLVVAVERELFGRALPDVPEDATLADFRRHPDAAHWLEIVNVPQAVACFHAADGAIVLMARADRLAHVGVWLKPERRVLHADRPSVLCEDLEIVRANGWRRLRFYERVA